MVNELFQKTTLTGWQFEKNQFFLIKTYNQMVGDEDSEIIRQQI